MFSEFGWGESIWLCTHRWAPRPRKYWRLWSGTNSWFSLCTIGIAKSRLRRYTSLRYLCKKATDHSLKSFEPFSIMWHAPSCLFFSYPRRPGRDLESFRRVHKVLHSFRLTHAVDWPRLKGGNMRCSGATRGRWERIVQYPLVDSTTEYLALEEDLPIVKCSRSSCNLLLNRCCQSTIRDATSRNSPTHEHMQG